jgi:hypothetical protein
MAALVGAAGLYGCTLLFPVTGLSDGAPAQPVVVAMTGTVTAPTGAAQQVHAFWASGAGEWVVAYFDDTDPMSLKSVTSKDFSTWTAGTPQPITCTSSSCAQLSVADGRDFSLDYKAIAGVDVVHAIISGQAGSLRQHNHLRAHVDPMAGLVVDGTVEFNGTTLDQGGLDPDGPATAITEDNHVIEMSSWYDDGDGGGGDSFAWVSTSPDPGNAAWPMDLGTAAKLEVVSQFVNSRAVVPRGGSNVVALWDTADQVPLPSNVHSAVYDGTGWSMPVSVFPDDEGASEDHNDWAAALPEGGAVHAVRRTHAGGFEHRQFEDPTWSVGAAIPETIDGNPLTTVSDGGVVLTAVGKGLCLFVISNDDGNPIDMSTWDGAAWSDWRVVVATGESRHFLTAAQSPPSGTVALFWTESSGGANVIEAARVNLP